MKTILVIGWLALFGGMMYSANQETTIEKLPMFNANQVTLKSTKGTWLQKGKPFTGVLFELSPQGDTIAYSGFLEGKEHGKWQSFYAPGMLSEERFYEHGLKAGTLKKWHENGQLQMHVQFSNGEYEGTLREWDANGLLIREANYEMGHEAGVQKAWYANGKIRSNYVIVKGRRYGLLGTKNCINVSDTFISNRK